MKINNIAKELQEWIDAEERAGRSADIDRMSDRIQVLMQRHNSTPRSDFNGLSPEQMHNIIYSPFSGQCVVSFNRLDEDQYTRIPLVRQVLFLLHTLSEADLKLTKLGWLPLKIVAEAYHLGSPDIYINDVFKLKRINEYDATSVMMARIILELLGWVKIRKGILSLTAKGKKAMTDKDAAANEILRFSLSSGGLHNLDGMEDDRIGNVGMAYSVWLLNKFGNNWHTDDFYQGHYQKVFDFPDAYNIYATRVFSRLFYWLGLVEQRRLKQSFNEEYKKTGLLSLIFTFKAE